MEKKAKKKRTRRNDIAEIVFAFFVAWLAYQALGFAVGTNLPIVAVVSCSMEHNADPNCSHSQIGFEDWWSDRGSQYSEYEITMEKFLTFPMRNGLSKGDLLVVVNAEPQVGDVVIYDRGRNINIVHRVVKKLGSEIITKGDNNMNADVPISISQIKGKVVFAVPLLGYPRFVLFIFGI